ncbi:polyamine ABC transporter substrate-binding protein [Cupriavidus necator]
MKGNFPRSVLIALVLLATALTAGAAGRTVNVYNWSDYIAEDTIPGFEQETGIKVRYDVYDSNETLQAKLLAGRSGYDVVVPSSHYAARQIAAGAYRKLDKSKLPNLKYLDPKLMQLIANVDPGNQYLVPWAWGTTGLGYNLTRARSILGSDAALDSWDILFKPEYLGRLRQCGVSMLDSPSDVFPSALHYLGKDPNSTNPDDYRAALGLLKRIRPYITQFNSSGYINDLAGGDVCLAYGWSGDVTIARHRARQAHKPYEIRYVIPRGGAPVWFDVMAIPRDATHVDAALQWINYIETPAIHAGITNAVFYPSANLAARKYVTPEVAEDRSVYPSESVMRTLFVLKPLPPAITRLQTRLWTEFKAGR